MGLTIEDRFKQKCKEHNLVRRKERILVACSGGPDSVALLYLLYSLAEELQVDLAAFCLNHGLRMEAAEELLMVKKHCEDLQIPFYGAAVDVQAYSEERQISVEMAGREIRYNKMYELLETEGFDVIALGHHKQDQAETVLLRLIRGTGLQGLGAMKEREGLLVRPLLDFTKKELIAYVETKGLSYAIDESNFTMAYDRNYIRLGILPMLEKLNPNVQDVLCRLAKTSAADEHCLQHFADSLYDACLRYRDDEEIVLSHADFAKADESLQFRLVRTCIRQLKGNGQMLSFAHWREIKKVLRHEGEASFQFQGMQVQVQYDKIKFRLLKDRTKRHFPKLHMVWRVQDGECSLQKGEVAVPLEWRNNLEVRRRRAGDRIALFNSEGHCIGHKKVKDYLIDQKVPRSERDEIWWLFFDGIVVGKLDKDKSISLVPPHTRRYLVGTVKEDNEDA